MITFDGLIQVINHVNLPKNDGILIYTKNYSTIIEYHDKTTQNINQFTVEYTTRYNYNTNNILLVDCIDFNKNNQYTAMIETNTLPLETLTDTPSDIAIKYQLARQHQYIGDITTSTYNQITNNNIPTIKYTRNNKDILIVNQEPAFNNFIINPNIIKTSVTINDKNTNRSFALSHKDYEDILIIQQTHNQTLEQLQNMTYKYTGAIESYSIVNQIISYDEWVDRFNEYQEFEGDLLSYTTFLISLKTIEFYDEYSDSKKEDYDIVWNRTSFITTECFINASKITINSYNPNMGVVVSGQVINKVYFCLETSSKLSIIESELINILHDRTGNRRVNSTFQIIANKIHYYNVSFVSLDNLIIVYDEEDQIALSIDLETGLITDYIFDEYDEYGHESYEECPNCMFMTNTYLMQGKLNVNTHNYNFSEDNSYEFGSSAFKFLYSIYHVYKVGFEIFKKFESNIFIVDSIIETFYDLHYQSLVKQLNGEESWTYKDEGYYNIYDKFECVGYSILEHTIPFGSDLARQLFRKGYIEDWKILTPQIYLTYQVYSYLKKNYPLYFKMNPTVPSLMDGYYHYALPPTEEEIKSNIYSYVAIRFNKNIFHLSAFGNYDRDNAFIVNQISREVTKLSPEESYTYFEGDSLFSQISKIFKV